MQRRPIQPDPCGHFDDIRQHRTASNRCSTTDNAQSALRRAAVVDDPATMCGTEISRQLNWQA
jgi:hypothetical protein